MWQNIWSLSHAILITKYILMSKFYITSSIFFFSRNFFFKNFQISQSDQRNFDYPQMRSNGSWYNTTIHQICPTIVKKESRPPKQQKSTTLKLNLKRSRIIFLSFPCQLEDGDQERTYVQCQNRVWKKKNWKKEKKSQTRAIDVKDPFEILRHSNPLTKNYMMRDC